MVAPPERAAQIGKDSKMNQIDKTKNKKIIGMAVAALAVLAAVIIGIVASKGNEGAKLQKLLDTGAKYLAELDYEQAVAVYNEAIALDPKSVDAYLGLAEAYLGMGDTEAAIAALEAGYEATGDQTIGDRLAELVEASKWLTLQYDFRPEDITLMGYNLFADHYQEISAAMAASRTWDEWSGNGNYSLETEDRWYSFQDDGETLHYQVNSISHPEPNAIYSETIWYVVYQNSDPNRQKADFRNIWTPHGYGEGMEDAVNAPIRNHQTFEEVCELLQVATIREKAQGNDNNTEEHGWYDFRSNLGYCHYYENFHGSDQEEADALVGTCVFEIYYENGYTFEIRFAVRRDGLIDSCQYSYYLEEGDYIEPSEPEEKPVEDDIWGYVEFDFDPKDVTIMGYDLFENHYAEISAAVLSDLMTNTNLYYHRESDYGVTYYKGRDANEREYSVDIEDEAYNLDYALVNGWSLEYDGDNFWGTGGTAFNMNIWSEDLFKIQDFISAPLFGNESYEDAAQLLRIDEIKENGRPTPDNSEEVARYYFKSNLGNCIYSEGMYGEEERISWHQLDIYYEEGKTFYISFERRNTGLIFDCNYGVLTEDNGYPDYLWTESWWESAFK